MKLILWTLFVASLLAGSGLCRPFEVSDDQGPFGDLLHLVQDGDSNLKQTQALLTANRRLRGAAYKGIPALDHALEVALRSRRVRTPTGWTIKCEVLETAKTLVASGADAGGHNIVGIPIMFAAIYSLDPRVVALLLEHKADPNAKGANSTLTCAISAGDQNDSASDNRVLPVVKLLVEHGAKVNVQDQPGTPVEYAHRRQYANTEAYLRQHGAK